MRARSKFGLPVALIALFSAITLAAWAAWTSSGTGAGAAHATMVNAGNTPTVSANSSAVTISWAPSTLVGGGAVDGYVVKRYNASDVQQSIGANCSGTITTLTCTENSVLSGTWKYSVTPKKASWTGAESAKTSVTVSAAAPTVGVTFPAASAAYNNAGWNGGCSSAICGTAAATAPATIASVKVSVRQGSGNYWSGSGSSFSSGTEVLVTAAGTTSWSLAFPGSNFPADGSYTVRVVATDSASASSSMSRTFTIDNTSPVNSLSLAGQSGGGSFLSGTTLYYKGATAGSFQIKNTLSDALSGPASSATSALGGTTTGWAHTASTVSTPSGGPYVSNSFGWNAGTTSSPTETVTGKDAVANQAVTTLTFVNDGSAPSGGSVSYTAGFYSATSVAVTFGTGTDAGSGVNATAAVLQRASAALQANGSCGTYGGFSTIVTAPTSPYTDSSVVSGNCYKFQYVVPDNVGNQATYGPGGDAKVKTAPVVTTSSLTPNSSGHTAVASGTAGTAVGDASSVTVVFCSNSSCSNVLDTQTGVVNASTGAWSVTSKNLGNGTQVYARASQTDVAGNTGVSAIAGPVTT